MFRAVLFAFLIASLPAIVQAQRGGISPLHGGGGPTHSTVGRGHSGGAVDSHGFVRTGGTGHSGHQRDGYGYVAFPYFLPDYETGWPEKEQGPEPSKEAPLVRVRDESRELEPLSHLPAQVIEIPNVSTSAGPKPLPATVFVLTSGEKLETQRYLLTASSVSLTIRRDQRTIPLQLVDLDSTIAANRGRGIELRIPSERNEVSLRF